MPETPFLVIAIDGGAASGKSSTARGVSARFGVMHVDTGSHYRFLTHHLLRRGARPDWPASVAEALIGLQLGTRVEGGEARIEVDGAVPGPEIRSAEVNENVSRFAALPLVRRFLLSYQRGQAAVARAHGFRGIVMEGRDIGSVIFPNAPVRIFLTADPEARTRRRAQEGQQDSILERDRADSQRSTAPLTCLPGATVIDSTNLSLEEVVDCVGRIVAPLLGPAAADPRP